MDPRDLGITYPEITMPEQFWIDDTMILPPAKDPLSVSIYRGPNIGAPPSAEMLPDVIRGVVAIKVGDKITTDHIMPAGSRLKYRSNIPKYAEFVFEGVDASFAKKALENKRAGKHNVVIAGASYGQGSSREHAAICPMFLGVKTVIAKSFERIHAANLINFGILPLTFTDEADYDSIGANDTIEIGAIKATLERGTDLVLKDLTNGKSILLKYTLSARQRDILLAGGMLNYTRMQMK
jgi:aconitate hydratase